MRNTNIKAPVIIETDYNKNSKLTVEKIENTVKETYSNHKNADNLIKYITDFPTVYIVKSKDKSEDYDVYVGETNDIINRTSQHLNEDPKNREDWEEFEKSDNARMYVIGHNHFNKSLTLDIENQMMMYMGAVPSVKKLNNRRTNSQNEYYPKEEKEVIFSKIWRKLHEKNGILFPAETYIRNSALFKASPFHSLTKEQINARNLIIEKVHRALEKELETGKGGQLILIEGEAGSGKTVLLSSIFSYLNDEVFKDDGEHERRINTHLLVNHDEQLKVYSSIAEKLGMEGLVLKPTTYIRRFDEDDYSNDVVLVDEAHLLLTQGKQSYQGKNQLKDLLRRAKVVVAVFDRHQILRRTDVWGFEELNVIEEKARENGNFIYLRNQMRIDSNEATYSWIRNLVDNGIINSIPSDDRYDLKIFDNPQEMEEQISKLSKNEEHGISRMLATYDWDFKKNKKPDSGNDSWCVSVGEWSMPWNYQLSKPKRKSKSVNYSNISWAEQPQTINEIGSTYTIQGFDLNYAGVVIGPSVKYRDGKIVFDSNSSRNKMAIERRTMDDGRKVDFSEELLKNELNVLLTRGVHGLYIYAVDPELRERLLEAQRERNQQV